MFLLRLNNSLQKTLFYFIFLFSTLFAQAQSPADSSLIRVQVQGISGGVARLVGTYADQNYLADTAIVNADGTFYFDNERLYPQGWYFILLPNNQGNFQLLIGAQRKFSMSTALPNLVGNMKVDGSIDNTLFFANFQSSAAVDEQMSKIQEKINKVSPNTTEYTKYRGEIEALNAQRTSELEVMITQHPNTFFTKFKQAGQNPKIVDFRKPNGDLDTTRQLVDFRSKMFESIPFADPTLLHTPVVMNKLKKVIIELTPQNPDSIIAIADPLIRSVIPHKDYFRFFVNWIALHYENGKTTVMDGEKVYCHIIKNYITKQYASEWADDKTIEQLQKKVSEMEASFLFKKGPDVVSTNELGQTKSIYEMQEPWIIVYMFSPNCEHCLTETPKLKQFLEQWKSKGVGVYGIGVNTNMEEWKAYIQKNQLTWTNVFDPTNRSIYAKYYVDNTPELYILNPDRIIVGKNLNVSQLEEYLTRQMATYKQ